MPAAAAGVSIGATVLGGVTQAKAQRASAKASSAQALRNAQLAEFAARDAIVRGDIEAARFRSKGRKLLGAQRTVYGASGAVVSMGSPVDVAAETAANIELDVMTIRTNAAREAWGHREQVGDFKYRSRLAEYAGRVGTAGTVLSTAGSLANIVGSGVFSRTRAGGTTDATAQGATRYQFPVGPLTGFGGF